MSLINDIEEIAGIAVLDYGDNKESRAQVKERMELDVRIHRLGLYLKGVDIGLSREYDLEHSGFINDTNRINKKNPYIKSSFKAYEDVSIRVSEPNRLEKLIDDTPRHLAKLDIMSIEDICELEDSIRYKFHDYKFDGVSKIHKSAWDLSDQLFSFDDKFQEFILSVNSGWDKRLKYYKFELYKKQAYEWLTHEREPFPINMDEDIQINYIMLERDKCLQNSLYALNRHLKLKDDKDKERRGYNEYQAWEAQALMLYLFDCEISYLMGKLRQIGGTSTIGGAGLIRTMLSKSYHCKLIAQKGKNSETIFRDKVKFPLGKLESWFVPTMGSDTLNSIRFGKKSKKGGDSGVDSVFEVDAPSTDAINGGSPSLVLLDELGLMDECSDIFAQGRPTMWRTNPVTYEMEYVRQVIGWGTGGNMKNGGSAFKSEFDACKEAFQDKDYKYGLIPLFLNAFAKPGMTHQIYEQEKNIAYRKKKTTSKGEDPKIIFHYTWPVTEDDMFLTSSQTLIPISDINSHIKKCDSLKKGDNLDLVYGHFEPIYDTSKPYDENFDIPFRIIGSKFVPANDDDILNESPLACCFIIKHPNKEFRNRYYKGTDPIDSESGSSKFSSSVWDALNVNDYPCAVLNFRVADYRFCYLQSLLLNLHYSHDNTGIKELVEYNIGKGYIDFLKQLGFGKNLVYSAMLPEKYQISGATIGISKKSHNAKFILAKLSEIIFVCSQKIMYVKFWQQLKTYVKKETASGTGEKYSPVNLRFDNDDILDSVTYSKICADCYSHKTPSSTEEAEKQKKDKFKYKYVNGSLKLVKVR